MNRRALLRTMLAALCVPSVAVAQPDRIRRIGWLDFGSTAGNLGLFEQAMAARGWIKGKMFAIESRSADGKAERLPIVTSELVRLPADVIVAPGVTEAFAAKNATKALPIVFAGIDDPVGRGLVANLARPGRNITGVALARRERIAKLLSLVRELAPNAKHVAVLSDAANADHRAALADLRSAARSAGMNVTAVEVEQYTDVEPAFATMRRQGANIVVVLTSSMFVPRWIADLALGNRLLLASMAPSYASEGGVLACSDDWAAILDRTAALVDRILNGAKPEALPVERATTLKVILNAKTARALKMNVPATLLAQANTVIE